jgi:hypothetical protein
MASDTAGMSNQRPQPLSVPRRGDGGQWVTRGDISLRAPTSGEGGGAFYFWRTSELRGWGLLATWAEVRTPEATITYGLASRHESGGLVRVAGPSEIVYDTVVVTAVEPGRQLRQVPIRRHWQRVLRTMPTRLHGIPQPDGRIVFDWDEDHWPGLANPSDPAERREAAGVPAPDRSNAIDDDWPTMVRAYLADPRHWAQDASGWLHVSADTLHKRKFRNPGKWDAEMERQAHAHD